jgi:hypothetical protein
VCVSARAYVRACACVCVCGQTDRQTYKRGKVVPVLNLIKQYVMKTSEGVDVCIHIS